MCSHSADEKNMKRVGEFIIMKYTFNQVNFNFYEIAAVWKQKDFCILSFKRACTQALTIGRITRRMGAHLTAFVANETLLKQLKFQGSALHSSTHTYTAVNEPWLSYKMVRSYYAIADVRRIPYKLFQMERAVFENLKVWSLDEAWGVSLRQKRNHEKSIWARINTGPSESGETVFPCDVTFWQVYLCWRLPGCRLVSENRPAFPTRLRSSVLRIVTFCPFCFYSFAADFQSYLLSNRGGGTLVCWASAAFRGHPHSSWSWSSAFREMKFTIHNQLCFNLFSWGKTFEKSMWRLQERIILQIPTFSSCLSSATTRSDSNTFAEDAGILV